MISVYCLDVRSEGLGKVTMGCSVLQFEAAHLGCRKMAKWAIAVMGESMARRTFYVSWDLKKFRNWNYG
jgi:hypothetical protein